MIQVLMSPNEMREPRQLHHCGDVMRYHSAYFEPSSAVASEPLFTS